MSLSHTFWLFRDKTFYQRGLGASVPNATAKLTSIQESIEGWEVSHNTFIAENTNIIFF